MSNTTDAVENARLRVDAAMLSYAAAESASEIDYWLGEYKTNLAALVARAREEGAREAQEENARYRQALEKIAHDHAAHARLIQCYDTLEERQAASLAVGWAQDRAKLALAVERVAP